jgi:hypothetical protein
MYSNMKSVFPKKGRTRDPFKMARRLNYGADGIELAGI